MEHLSRYCSDHTKRQRSNAFSKWFAGGRQTVWSQAVTINQILTMHFLPGSIYMGSNPANLQF
jgi:hypothetical protein